MTPPRDGATLFAKDGGVFPMTDRELARWLVDLVLAFGGSVSTAYTVAGLFMRGLGR